MCMFVLSGELFSFYKERLYPIVLKLIQCYLQHNT